MNQKNLKENIEKALEMEGGIPLAMILTERLKQEVKWGQQNHKPEIFLAILMEEVGELAQAILETNLGFGENQGIDKIKKETIHCAAVSLAMLECIEIKKVKK